MMWVQMTEQDERYAPPERLLDIGVTAGNLFLTISDYEETGTTRTLKEVASFSVNLESFMDAVDACAADDHRDMGK
jgi:hypothetical protein